MGMPYRPHLLRHPSIQLLGGGFAAHQCQHLRSCVALCVHRDSIRVVSCRQRRDLWLGGHQNAELFREHRLDTFPVRQPHKAVQQCHTEAPACWERDTEGTEQGAGHWEGEHAWAKPTQVVGLRGRWPPVPPRVQVLLGIYFSTKRYSQPQTHLCPSYGGAVSTCCHLAQGHTYS